MNPAAAWPGRFQPLGHVLFADDFDQGFCGWTALIGNYEDTLDSVLPEYADLRPPQLSNQSMWDTGTAGSLNGSWSLKLATRACRDSLAVAIKRLTFRRPTRIRFECYICYKPEASSLRLSATALRAFGLLFDIQDGFCAARHRWMPHLRYLNAADGARIGHWQTKGETRALRAIGASGETVSHFHLGPEGWSDLAGSAQLHCYNEIATKMNWSYLRVDLDLAGQRFLGFQFDGLSRDANGMQVIKLPPMPNLFNMLNIAFWVEADTARRCFLYVDSCLLSAAEL